MIEEFAMYLDSLGITYLVTCAMCLFYTISLLIANWWAGEDIEGSTLIGAILVSIIPVLNVYAFINSIGTLFSCKIGKFSIKGRKKQ